MGGLHEPEVDGDSGVTGRAIVTGLAREAAGREGDAEKPRREGALTAGREGQT